MFWVVEDSLHGPTIFRNKFDADGGYLGNVHFLKEMGYKVQGRGYNKTFSAIEPTTGEIAWTDLIKLYPVKPSELAQFVAECKARHNAPEWGFDKSELSLTLLSVA